MSYILHLFSSKDQSDSPKLQQTVGRLARRGVGLGLVLLMVVLISVGVTGGWWRPVSITQAANATSPLYVWGDNSYGGFCNGTNANNSPYPLPVSLPGGATPTALAASYAYSLVLASDGKLYACGLDASGQLGNGSANTNPNPNPVLVNLPTGVSATAIAAGSTHGLAIGSDGKLYAWGANGNGQLGDGNTNDRFTPGVVNLPAGVTPTAIAAGNGHSLAIGNDGKLYAWGYNQFGQLGNGANTDSSTPVVVNLPTGVGPTAIAASSAYSLAAGSDGKVYGWGVNNGGQLGNGTTSNSNTPVVVSLPSGVSATALSANYFHNLAIGSDGKLYAWGDNHYGQYGDGTTTSGLTPVVVSLPAGVTPTVIATGYYHSLAVGSDANLYAWGDNENGQLGNGTYTNSSIPLKIASTGGTTTPLLIAGYIHNLAFPLAIPSQIAAASGSGQTAATNTAFSNPLVATVRDVVNNPVLGAAVTFTAPASGASGTFVGGSTVYTGTTDASGIVTTTTFTANALSGTYAVTATVINVSSPVTFTLTNCEPLLVTSELDDGTCGTLRQAVSRASTGSSKAITLTLSAGSTITLTTGLTLTTGVSITTTAGCGAVPPIIIHGVGANSGVGLTVGANNYLFGVWVRGFSGTQIKAPAGSHAVLKCVKASKT